MPASIATIRAQTLQRIEDITAEPKPSYNVGGQSVQWAQYLKQLQETIDWCDSQLQADEPFEITAQGFSPI